MTRIIIIHTILSLTTLFLVGGILTSRGFDVPVTSFIEFLQRFSLLYFLAYYLIVAIVVYLIYIILVKRGSIKESILLYSMFLLAFSTHTPLLLFICPLPYEVHRIAKIYHILDSGTLRGMPPHPESVGHMIFWGVFISVTSLDIQLVTLYLGPILMLTFVILFLYTALRKITSCKYAFIGIAFIMVLLYEPIHMSRQSFAYVLFIISFTLALMLFKKETLGTSLALILSIASLIVSHPISLYFIAFLTILSIFFGRRYISLIVISIAMYCQWFIFIYSMLPGYDRLPYIWRMLSGGALTITPLKQALAYPSEISYLWITYMRLFFGVTFPITPLILLIIYQLRQNKIKQIKLLESPLIITMTWCYPFMLLSGLYSISTFIRTLQFSTPFISALLALGLTLQENRKLAKLITTQIGIGLTVILLTLWIPNTTYFQTPLEKVHVVRFFSLYAPLRAETCGIGISAVQNYLFQYIYGSRKDLFFNACIDIEERSFINNIYSLKCSYILVFGSAIVRELKYVFSPPLDERIVMAQTILEKCYNKIYTSSQLYAIYNLNM